MNKKYSHYIMVSINLRNIASKEILQLDSNMPWRMQLSYCPDFERYVGLI